MIGYIIKHENEGLVEKTLSSTEIGSIAKQIAAGDTRHLRPENVEDNWNAQSIREEWALLQQKGYSCVEVEITEVPKR